MLPRTLLPITMLTLLLCGTCAADPNAITAIRSLTDPAKIATLKSAYACNERLLKVVYWLNHARGQGSPVDDVVEQALLPQTNRQLVKESLLRNLVIAERLGLLTDANLDRMRRGRSPEVTSGPYSGEPAEVDHILPVAKFPQFSKEFWNLELMPRTLNRRKGDSVGQRQLDLLRKIQPSQSQSIR
jgi:hypothetical protein